MAHAKRPCCLSWASLFLRLLIERPFAGLMLYEGEYMEDLKHGHGALDAASEFTG